MIGIVGSFVCSVPFWYAGYELFLWVPGIAEAWYGQSGLVTLAPAGMAWAFALSFTLDGLFRLECWRKDAPEDRDVF